MSRINQKVLKRFEANFQDILIIGQGTDDKVMVIFWSLNRLWPFISWRSKAKIKGQEALVIKQHSMLCNLLITTAYIYTLIQVSYLSFLAFLFVLVIISVHKEILDVNSFFHTCSAFLASASLVRYVPSKIFPTIVNPFPAFSWVVKDKRRGCLTTCSESVLRRTSSWGLQASRVDSRLSNPQNIEL